MIGLITPLQLTDKGIARTERVSESIDSFLTLLINSVCGETCIDEQFGFVFNNMRFEIFDEKLGVVYNSLPKDSTTDPKLYDKKISGKSTNFNTFSAELKNAVEQYETRLTDVEAGMTYVRRERKIYITISGVIKATNESYQFDTVINTKK